MGCPMHSRKAAEALNDLVAMAPSYCHNRENHRIHSAVGDPLAHTHGPAVTPWEDHSLRGACAEHLVGVRMIWGPLDHLDGHIALPRSLHSPAGKHCHNRNRIPGQNTRLGAGPRAEKDEGRSFSRAEASALDVEGKP